MHQRAVAGEPDVLQLAGIEERLQDVLHADKQAGVHLLRLFGVAWSLFVFPVWYVMTYGIAGIQFNLVTSVAIQLGERIWIPAIHRPMTARSARSWERGTQNSSTVSLAP